MKVVKILYNLVLFGQNKVLNKKLYRKKKYGYRAYLEVIGIFVKSL